MSDNWALSVFAYGLTAEEADALFDRVADAAHEKDEQVCCSMGPQEEQPASRSGRFEELIVGRHYGLFGIGAHCRWSVWTKDRGIIWTAGLVVVSALSAVALVLHALAGHWSDAFHDAGFLAAAYLIARAESSEALLRREVAALQARQMLGGQ